MTQASVFTIHAPDQQEIQIPVTQEAAADPYRSLHTAQDIHEYYQQNGYVVVRDVIPTELCDRARDIFQSEIKPSPAFMYRQPSSGNAEQHQFSDQGFMVNSILNLHDLSRQQFPQFTQVGIQVLTHSNLQRVAQAILQEEGIIVQSMYFEGNPATWAHQDTYYLDSERLGAMTAVWIALEDIQPGAGRFYIYPGSHQIDMSKNGGDFDISFNHARYKDLILSVIRSHQLECRAPALRKGDVLFWSARTIHGSLETTQPWASRHSITAHFIPASAGFMQYQSRLRSLHLERINGQQLHHPKDQNQLKNRLILGLETRFPQTFRAAKRFATKLVTR